MTLLDALAVLAAGFAAGGINAIVGSGSLITFPVLLAVGYSSVTANVSNSVGLVFGNLSAASGYRAELEGQRERALMGGTGTALGAIVGGVLLLTLPEGVFEAVVPALILVACALMILRPKPKLSHGSLSHHRKIGLVAIGFAVGVYGGYFGAAQGVILLAALRFLIPDSLQRLNGLKNVMVGVANGIAAILFVIVAHVAWEAAALVAVGSIVGAQVGARYGRRVPDEGLRWAVVTVGVAVAIILFVK
ncbi:MAG: sulfite exporter TauE/SafE family protein [Actinobacteria bacterium]|nr:sulfite exporter TauE/SafE family protein [Actinomycetota bacterium]